MRIYIEGARTGRSAERKAQCAREVESGEMEAVVRLKHLAESLVYR